MTKADPLLAKNVVFLFVETDKGAMPIGTGFFIGVRINERQHFTYLVTAEHVVEGASKLGKPIVMRANLQKGGSEVATVPLDAWRFHPESAHKFSDVAVATVRLNTDELDLMLADTSLLINETIVENEAIGPGDDVTVVGLFVHHPGPDRNVPIFRQGQLASFPKSTCKRPKGATLRSTWSNCCRSVD